MKNFKWNMFLLLYCLYKKTKYFTSHKVFKITLIHNTRSVQSCQHSETEPGEIINADSFTTYDQSELNQIDPDINYLNTQNSINGT